MKIKKLNIKNFRCFENFEINFFDENLNLIVGENSVWKTTIFESIRLLLDERLSIKNYFDDVDFRNREEGIFIEIQLSFLKDDQNLFYFKDCISEIIENEVIVLIGLYKESKDVEEIYYGKRSFLFEWIWPTINDFKISVYEIQKRYLRVLYIDGTRAHNNFYENQGFFHRLIKELYTENRNSITVSKDDIREVSQIKKILGLSWESNFPDFLNELNLEQDVKKTVHLDDDEKLSFRTFFNLLKLKLDEKFLDENSVGWQYLFFAAFAVFYIKELKNLIQETDNAHYIILMEEPEAHLHPQSQRNLINFLRGKFENETDASIFISTHSPNVIRSIKNIERIQFIKKNANKSLPEKIDDNLSIFKEKLNIFIDVNKAEILFARWIIFVEWIAEEILLPSFFQNYFWKSLDSYGISLISVNSTDFYCYALYAKALKIPFVIVTDGDITKESSFTWIERKMAHSDLFNDQNYFIGFDTFEIDLIFSGNKNFLFDAFALTGETTWSTRYWNFQSAVNRLLGFDFTQDNAEMVYKTIFAWERDSILNNYIKKSESAYALLMKLNEDWYTGFNMPDYIKNAFTSLLSLLNVNPSTSSDMPERVSHSYGGEEINIEDIPF